MKSSAKHKIKLESVSVKLAKKFNIPVKIASLIRNKNPSKIKVKEFCIYDISDLKDPNLIAMNALLAKNPDYKMVYWQQSGPCSNWGYDVYRPETEQEYESRILAEAKRISESELQMDLLESNWVGIDIGIELK